MANTPADETEMRDAVVPTPTNLDELMSYVASLVERQHDYGTCVYAMSMAATATFHYVASKLGASGFQASCADLDILRRTRDFKWGRVVDYENLLFPQYCNAEHYPGWRDLMADKDVRAKLREMAREMLSERKSASPGVIAHWTRLAETEEICG